jgi:single-strand DNA-binding protein
LLNNHCRQHANGLCPSADEAALCLARHVFRQNTSKKRRAKAMSELGVNKVILIGRCGCDSELKFTQSGKPVANFSVAVNESFKNSNGDNVDRVEWFRCVAWNGLAELCGQYLIRGKQCYLEGRLQTRKYDDKEGKARTITEVVVSTLRLLAGSANGSNQAQADRGEQPSRAGNGAPDNLEDVPF